MTVDGRQAPIGRSIATGLTLGDRPARERRRVVHRLCLQNRLIRLAQKR